MSVLETPEPVNILLVDDQPGKLLSYETVLGELGENLLMARSAREALEILLKTDVAVILIDVCMPELDGFELAQMIREHPRFQDTAIIFISAIHLSEIDSLKGYEMGGVDYVPVPVVPGVLRAKVRVFIDLYRKTQALARLNDALEQRVADRTAELESATKRQELLAREVDHRARNALAVIQSIVSLTAASSPADFVTSINGRIRAMARAHTLLSQSRWEGADLARLVEEELAPYREHRSIAVSGSPVLIRPTVAQNLALALHELATNAAKYGGLSSPDGQLSVHWTLGPDHLTLDWREEASRDVVKPARRGFGSKVIDSSIRAQLGGELEQHWRPNGLHCTMRLPSAHFAPPALRYVAAYASHEGEPAQSAPMSLEGARLLVVEDEPLVALLMHQIFSDSGAEIVGPCNSLQEAEAKLNEPIDVAVLDVNVGGTLVYPIAEALRRRGVPFVFVTGYQSDSVDAAFADAPVLTKPVEASEAIERVALLLAEHDAAQGSRQRSHCAS